MELAKSRETVEQPWHDGVVRVDRSDEAIDASSKFDQDLVRAWEIKAAMHWVRNDHGPVDGLRWRLWDKYGLGRPPSVVKHRPAADNPTVAMHGAASSPSHVLRLVTLVGGSPRESGLPAGRARVGVVNYS
jgi:hypothetical protein